MPDPYVVLSRVAREAVRIQFDPGQEDGTAVFLINLAKESGSKEGIDRGEALQKARFVAEKFIAYVEHGSM